MPGDTCINQFLSITHKMCLDDVLEVRGVLLDISKVFDKVWHKGIIFKLKQNGICSVFYLTFLRPSPNVFNLCVR